MRLMVFAVVLVALACLMVTSGADSKRYQAPWPWIALADCESGGDSTPGRPPYTANWHIDDYHDGGLQFLPSTWNAAKSYYTVRHIAARYAYAHHAPAWVQVRVAMSWQRRTSWAQWPDCSRKVGLR